MSKTYPATEMKGLTFFPVPEFTDVELAFGARAERYFNRYDLPEVPEEFKRQAMQLFYNGGHLPEFDQRVDPKLAFRATRALLSSWEPSHEAKEATVGYAFWVWSNLK